VENVEKSFAVWKCLHGAGKILVSLGTFRNHPAEPGKYSGKIECIELLEGSAPRFRELQDHGRTAGPNDSEHLPKSFVEVRKIPNAKCHHDGVEPVVRKSKTFCRSFFNNNAWFQAAPENFLLSEFQHFRGKVDTADVFYREFGGFNRKIAGPSGDVEDRFWVMLAEKSDRFSPPKDIESEAEEMVQKVVVRGNLVEQ
jgi:hypothetical protein